VIVQRDVPVPMRDGVVLRADVYLPGSGTRGPAVLARTPYDRSFSLTPPAALDPERATGAGYALVCQDVRGRHGSDGEFYPFRSEGTDGYDSVEWVAAQPWSDGTVAMAGRSYTAATQWLAAAERPPHLRAICPVVVGSNYFDGWVYQGGAFQLGFNLFWVQLMTGRKTRPRLTEQYRHLPLSSAPLLDEGESGRFYRDWLAHPTEDEYWRALAFDRSYGRIEVPALNVGGWFDIFLAGTLANYVRLRLEGASEAARQGTRLVIGPYAHGSTYGQYPDHAFPEFGANDRIDLAELQLSFLDRHLREGAPDGSPPVRIFVMGENRWRDEDDWPLARAREQRWHLRSEGLLSPDPPGDEPADEYVYDPCDPAPTIGGPTSLPGTFLRTNSGPADQRQLEGRADVLSYTSARLERPLEVTGPLSVVLHAASSAADTDFVAKLCDVDPEGVARILAEGVLRARFRAGYDRPLPLEPGRVYEYRIDLAATSNVFAAGHRIRLLVTSSSFPRFDRNAGVLEPPGEVTGDDLRPARQAIFHDARRRSHLVLPVVGGR
jgi:putative CocE/NonD family hydrolase